jgi:UDP:flavonoid glycosyltransferase YjiC (YdhE family)
MRITILAFGSQGDVQPYAALGKGLAAAGYSVTLASHETFQGLAKSCGLGFARISGNPMDIVHGEAGQSWLNSTDSYLRFLSTAKKLAKEVYPEMAQDAFAACQGSDALIYSLPLSVCGYSISLALRVPGIPAALYPLHPTSSFPSIMTPGLSLGRGVNWFSGTVVMHLFWQASRSLLNAWHRQFGLGSMPVLPPLLRLEKQGLPFLYGYSPVVIPRPSNWPANRTVCGYWFLDGAGSWQPDARLADFLRGGPPPIYVGFGSMASGDSAQMTGIILEAMARTGQRALLASGWGGLQADRLPNTVLPVAFVPHDWLFPRVSVAIHHGGAGTTAAVLRAGVPAIVVPFFADQFFWGRRVCALGVGARPIPRKELTVTALERGIRSALDGDGMAARARQLADAIRAEDGIAVAVRAVNDHLK